MSSQYQCTAHTADRGRLDIVYSADFIIMYTYMSLCIN